MGTFIDDILGVGTLTPDSLTNIVDLPILAEAWALEDSAQDNAWESVIFGDGLFVAVASSGTDRVMTSPDGATWTSRTAAEANDWQAVTFGNGLFVAVSNDGTDQVMTSPDGITWTSQTGSIVAAWSAITFGNGLFVAVDSTNVMISTDGINWTTQVAAEANSWQSVIFGNGLFVAVSFLGSNRIMTSPDGITWTSRSAPSTNLWQAVTFGNGLFVGVSTGANDQVMTSPDGITWTERTESFDGLWRAVTFGNGLFVAVTFGDTNSMTSPDGINWTTKALPQTGNWLGITFGNNTFVTVSDAATGEVVSTLFNGNLSGSSAALKVDSTLSGFLPPRMTTAERDIIANPDTGLIIYNTDTNSPEYFDGTTWQQLNVSLGSAFGFTNGNNSATPITDGTYDTIAVNGFADNGSSGFSLTTPNNAIYTYNNVAGFDGTINVDISAFKNTNSEKYRFAVSIDGAVPVFANAIYGSMLIDTSQKDKTVTLPVQLSQGQTVQIMVAGDGSADNIFISDLLLSIQ